MLTSEVHDPYTRKTVAWKIEQHRNTFKRGPGVEPAKFPPKVKSENVFTTLECWRGVSYTHIPFLRVLGSFYSGEVLSSFLVEQASQTCWASLSDLLSKSLKLAGQASHACRTSFLKRDGQVCAFVLSGAHVKEWTLPSLGLWIWAYWARQWAHWAYQALSHILPSSSLIIWKLLLYIGLFAPFCVSFFMIVAYGLFCYSF